MKPEFKKTLDAIDSAIGQHVKTNRTKGSVVTGWIVLASVSDVESVDRDGYILQSSPGMSHHVQLGLLNMALDDKRNIGLLGTIKALMDGNE